MSATPSSNPIETGRAIAEHATRLAKLELELKAVELRAQATRLGFAGGLGLLAILLTPLLVAFLLATLAAALATVVDVWLAILIVSGFLLLLVGGLAGASALLVSSTKRRRSDEER